MPSDQPMLGPKLHHYALTSPFLHLATLAGALLIAPITRAQAPAPTLALMQDRYRPLLIFAYEGDPRLPQQVETLKLHRDELINRQIRLVPFFPGDAGPVDREILTLLPQEELTLRKRFRIKDHSFTVILLGKDGGEKLRSNELITFERLRDTIDAMPMRQQEVGNSRAIQRRAKP